LKRLPDARAEKSRRRKEGVAGYENVLNFNGVAFALVRARPSEIKSPAKIHCWHRQRGRAEGRTPAATLSPAFEVIGNLETRACANFEFADVLRAGFHGRH